MTFSTPTLWMQSRERSYLTREQHRRQMLEELSILLESLAGKYNWTELILFGSIIQPGRFSKDSDIDLAVAGLRKHDLFPFVAELSRELGRNVDVLILEESPLEQHIRRKGKLWAPQKQ